VTVHLPAHCQDLLDIQHGVIARWQAAQSGLNVRTIDAWLHSRRWQRLYDGVYATYTGQPSRRAVQWAGVLRAGRGAGLGYHTAAELDGLGDRPVDAIHVIVSSSRRVVVGTQERGRGMPPVVVHYSARINDAIHPSRTPPRTRLEWRYIRGVERPHRLPRALRQAKSSAGERTRYLDNRYREFGVAVELDGQAAHPAEARWRDVHRDNASARLGIVTLRYGWADVTGDPCRVAVEIAQVLQLRGWTGRPWPCGPNCTASLS
jgi:hypothetical protein